MVRGKHHDRLGPSSKTARLLDDDFASHAEIGVGPAVGALDVAAQVGGTAATGTSHHSADWPGYTVDSHEQQTIRGTLMSAIS